MTSPNRVKRRKNSVLVLAAMLALGVASLAAAQGSSSEEVTLANLEERLEAARTASDHQAIAAFYQEQAEHAQENASKHESMARTYKRKATKVVRSSGALVEHCHNLVTSYQSLADNLFALAKEHQAMASEAN